MRHSDLSEKSSDIFCRKGVIEHIDFLKVPKSIFEGLGRFADNHFRIIKNIKLTLSQTPCMM